MKKEEAKLKLQEAQSNLEIAERVLEIHENGVRELREDIEELEAIINKKDDWRDKLTQPDTTGFYFIERDKYQGQGFVVEEGFFSERKPEHAFKRWAQAELIMDKMLLMQEMYAFAHVKNEGWLPDWEDLSEEKFGVLYSAYVGLDVDSSKGCNYFIFGVVVKSQEIAEEMLEEFGERIEKIYNKQY